jgi:hypothetical protein
MASAVACWKSCIRRMPLPFLASFVITDLITSSGLCGLKKRPIWLGEAARLQTRHYAQITYRVLGAEARKKCSQGCLRSKTAE